MKQRVAEMEMEANKLRELQAAAEQNQASDAGSAMETDEDKAGADGRSVYVGNVRPLQYAFHQGLLTHLRAQVDYGATPEEIQAHFQACGTINRVTILCDKFTGHPKGYVDILL